MTWQTAYDVRFDTLATGSYGGNGHQTIGGVQWDVSNYGNSKSIGIIPGTGLIFAPNTTSTDFGFSNARGAPLLATTASLIFPQLSLASHEFRVWALLNPDNAAANFEAAFLGIEQAGGDATEPQTYTLKRLWSSATGWAMQFSFSGTNVLNTPQDTRFSTHNVMMIHWLNERNVRFFSGNSSDGKNWPADSTLMLRGNALTTLYGASQFGTQTTRVSASLFPSQITGSSDIGIAFGAAPNNTNGTFTGSFRRFRFDWKA